MFKCFIDAQIWSIFHRCSCYLCGSSIQLFSAAAVQCNCNNVGRGWMVVASVASVVAMSGLSLPWQCQWQGQASWSEHSISSIPGHWSVVRMSGMCGCLCSSSGHDMCPLCGDYIPGISAPFIALKYNSKTTVNIKQWTSIKIVYVPGEDWLDGKHRWQCGQRNTAKLSTFPAHPSVQCDRLLGHTHCIVWPMISRCDGKIRLWPPGHKFRCSSAPGLCVTAEHGVKIKNVGKNR